MVLMKLSWTTSSRKLMPSCRSIKQQTTYYFVFNMRRGEIPCSMRNTILRCLCLFTELSLPAFSPEFPLKSSHLLRHSFPPLANVVDEDFPTSAQIEVQNGSRRSGECAPIPVAQYEPPLLLGCPHLFCAVSQWLWWDTQCSKRQLVIDLKDRTKILGWEPLCRTFRSKHLRWKLDMISKIRLLFTQ